MASITLPETPAADPRGAGRPSSFLRDLEGQPAFGHIGPNWFAAVMGTGIVANAAATLPAHGPALLIFARVVWMLDLVLLAVVLTATVLHWIRHPEQARGTWTTRSARTSTALRRWG